MTCFRISLAFALATVFATAFAQDGLRQGFQNPPESAKPQTWWHWINGNISNKGITADLEAMKRVGIGGAEIFNVEVGIPAGKTPFMSPQWNDAIAHAISEGRRLGMEICVHNCAGWSSSGGPWITPANAMQFLSWSETPVHGPTQFDDTLKQPVTKENYYRDIAVYAIKNPSNDSFRIPNIRVKAAFDRGDRILPDLNVKADGAAIPKSDIRILPIGANGSVSWNVPDGDWTIIRMGYTPTGEGNHPAPASGYGLEVDKLSKKALDTHWAGMVSSVLKDAGHVSNPGLCDVLIDSYEVGSQNWTPEFRQEFQKRRGYDPLPFLPVVTGRVVGSVETSERFLWDFRRTICDLFNDNYYGYFTTLCHQHGLKFSDEGYGNGEFDNLQVCGAADIPMGEFWVGGGSVETTKLAASAGHIYGKPIIGAESFTADTPHGRWMADPYSIKALGDRVFAMGINRFIFHRYALQPWLDALPGMTMGPWGTHFDRTETWWNQSAAWMKYLARSQYLLQSGRFVADIACYTGEEGPNDVPLMQGNPIPAGYDYDGLDESSLMKMTVDHGQLVLPSGMRYRILLLPDNNWMTAHVAHKIAMLVKEGAVVVGAKPKRSPSLSDAGKGDLAVSMYADVAWAGTDGKKFKSHRYGAGEVYGNQDLSSVLADIKCGPDVDRVQGWELNWIHRSVNGADVYFIANPKYTPGEFELSFRVAGKQPEIWNPETGESHPADVWVSKNGRTSLPLHLDSAGSTFVIFRKQAAGSHLVSLTHTGGPGAPKHIAPKIEIISARYEASDGAGGVEVTAKVRQMVARGVEEIAATNGNFGDPAYNHVKHLQISYRINGRSFEKSIPENDNLDFGGGGAGSDTAAPEFSVQDGILYAWSPGSYEGLTSTGRSIHYRGANARTIPVNGPWKLTFPPNLGAPASIDVDHLASWTENEDSGVKYFSGSATYHGGVDVPASMLTKGYAPYLDLGRVKNIAEVWLNGKLLPTLWKAPFRIQATGLKAGRNDIQIRVTNLWPNRLIGDDQLPAEVQSKRDGSIAVMPDWALNMEPKPKGERVTFTTWDFFKKDSPLLESGLLGPVKIVMVPMISLRR